VIRPYVDRPISDAAAAAHAAIVAAEHWRLDGPMLVRIGMNAIFASGGTVMRVGRPTTDAHASIDLARMLLAIGLRVPAPRRDDVVVVGDLSVTCWERLTTSSSPIDWRAVGAMIRRVHRLDEADIPSGYPVPVASSFPWWDFEALLEQTRPLLDDAARRGIEAAIERGTGWQHAGDHVVCHGDVHPGNIVMTHDGPVLLDWDLLCRAPNGWDHAPMMTWHERWGGKGGEYDEFASGYGASMRADTTAEALAELRLVAATLMRLKAGLTDAAAAAEAERRLRFWRGEPNAPAWHAQ
jgi:Phosphotransferase enzyme family